ncbi:MULTISPECIES: hypothetical protein [Pseudomonas]|jgi:hypothetical protein|uniref:hypothetical protein n=1 Tax=Pseudomonas TaxID=286 RepID=UPI000A1F6BA9|nr:MULTISPECIES: hypothetical protein [Pseudomonas]MCH4901972.1 hypothetical protein [Pseudomonas sp. B707]PNB46884.1 hypothetical protein C1X29_25890 [Pseudomonas sp. GW456-12-10-14-LB2]TEA63836.1 hypothetical protein EIY71_01775 [Pseudomonas sp. CH235]
MNAVIRRTSFAPGNFVTAKAFANGGAPVADFTASSRLIETKKVGPDKIDAVEITAIDRPPSGTKAKTNPARELTLIVPDGFPIGKHVLTSRSDVAVSYKDGTAISEGISGDIEIKPASDQKNVAADFNVTLENADGTTFQLKGGFQVLK